MWVESAPESAGKVRRLVAAAFREMGCSEETVHLGITVATELATNAYKHGSVDGSPIVVRVYRSADGPVVEVRDASDALPEVRGLDLVAESGRGLLLMEALVTRWGFELLDTGGKIVWAVIKMETGT